MALPTSCLPHLASGVGLERVENYFRMAARSHYRVYVVCPNVESPQLPSSNSADFLDGFFHRRSATSAEVDGWTFKSTLVVLQPTAIGCNQWRTVTVVKDYALVFLVESAGNDPVAKAPRFCIEWSSLNGAMLRFEFSHTSGVTRMLTLK